VNKNIKPNAVNDMLADADLGAHEAAAVRAVLDDIAALAAEVPEPSSDVRAFLSGAVPMRSRRRGIVVAAAASALALGGVSAAAASNRLPDPIQEIVANATEGVLPVDVPHPAKPVNPPYDAPGHVRNKPKAPKPTHPATPSASNTDAPGQIQKSTKPSPAAPGPARPADPGSHGRARNADKTDSGSDHTSDDSGDADQAGPTEFAKGKLQRD
jgi:hypothetical protein